MNTALIDKKHDESILLKIRRQFTSDEAVQAVLQILSKKDIEIGILKSEVSELQHEIIVLKQPAPIVKVEGETKPKKEWMKDDLIKLMQDQYTDLTLKQRDTKKALKIWQNRACNANAKLLKYESVEQINASL